MTFEISGTRGSDRQPPPHPHVCDITRSIGDPLFVDNLEVLERPTVRKEVEKPTGGRAVHAGSGPTRIVVGEDEGPVDGHTEDGPLE